MVMNLFVSLFVKEYNPSGVYIDEINIFFWVVLLRFIWPDDNPWQRYSD